MVFFPVVLNQLFALYRCSVGGRVGAVYDVPGPGQRSAATETARRGGQPGAEPHNKKQGVLQILSPFN